MGSLLLMFFSSMLRLLVNPVTQNCCDNLVTDFGTDDICCAEWWSLRHTARWDEPLTNWTTRSSTADAYVSLRTSIRRRLNVATSRHRLHFVYSFSWRLGVFISRSTIWYLKISLLINKPSCYMCLFLRHSRCRMLISILYSVFVFLDQQFGTIFL